MELRRTYINDQHQSQLHTLPIAQQTFRCFLVRFDNAKKQGKRGIQHLEAYGVEFPEGEVVISTRDVPRKGYANMTDLLETLAQYGNVEVEELGEVSV